MSDSGSERAIGRSSDLAMELGIDDWYSVPAPWILRLERYWKPFPLLKKASITGPSREHPPLCCKR